MRVCRLLLPTEDLPSVPVGGDEAQRIQIQQCLLADSHRRNFFFEVRVFCSGEFKKEKVKSTKPLKYYLVPAFYKIISLHLPKWLACNCKIIVSPNYA